PKGIILSGGPRSVNEEDAPGLNADLFDFDVPVLGLCYGLQILLHQKSPGSVEVADRREFGRSELIIDVENDLFQKVPQESVVWMSHADHIKELPRDYNTIAHTDNARVAAVRHKSKPIY